MRFARFNRSVRSPTQTASPASMVVRIEAAKAFGQALASARMTVWGDPNTVQKMSESFFRGQQFGFLTDGLLDNLPENLKAAVGQAAQRLNGSGANGATPAASAVTTEGAGASDAGDGSPPAGRAPQT